MLNHKFIACLIVLVCISFSYNSCLLAQDIPLQSRKKACEVLLNSIFDDIIAVQDKYPELKALKKDACVKGIRMLYHHRAEYERSPDGKKGNWKLETGGCVIKIQFYFKGYNWNDLSFRSDANSIYSLLSKIETNIQARIISPNAELRDEIELIIRDSIANLM
jgi:hypothetical protein